jgi:hypothetical protein
MRKLNNESSLLMQISWTIRRKGQTKTAVVTLGTPFLAILLILGGGHFDGIQKVMKLIHAMINGGG